MLPRSASPSFAASSKPSSTPCARSAFAGRSAIPIEPSEPHHGLDAGVQLRDEVLEQLEPHARRPAREAVRDEQELRAHDVGRRRVTLADAVLEDEAPVELGELARLDARPLAHADAGREAVDRCVALECALDDRPSARTRAATSAAELDLLTAARDRDEFVE